MADEILLDENGVPMSDGLGGTTTTNDSNTGQGSGASNSVGQSSTSGTSGTASNDNESNDTSDAKLVEDAVATYLKASAVALTFEQLVPLYVDNKLGFAELKESYKKANPDVDPGEIDKAVDTERQAAIDSFTKEGSNAKDELKKKYDEFKQSLVTIKKELGSLPKEFAKTTGEALMPTTIGLGAPNPLSITLKLYNGISKIKRILDRVFAAIAVFIAASKALGLDGSEGYNQVMSFIAIPLKLVQDLISKQEADPKYQESVALANYLEEAKKNWPHGQTIGLTYQDIEDIGRTGFGVRTGSVVINTWPMEPKDRARVEEWYNICISNPTYSKQASTINAILKYNDYLGWAIKEFKKNQKTLTDSNTENNDTSSNTTTSDANSSGGTSNNLWKSNTYGLSGLDKTGSK